VAGEYSLNRLTETTRCRSVHTVQKYLGHLEEAFLFFSLRRFSFKVREQSRANRKIYCIDNGFVTARGFQFSGNRGSLCENLVAVTLKKRELEGACEVFFWKSAQQEEVDFVVKQDRRVTQLIQVCWDLRAVGTRSREVRALLKASRELSCEALLILTAETEAEEHVTWHGMEGTVRLVPLWKWLAGDRTSPSPWFCW
jgi:predicted AAA+ superfamily ATPase